MKVNGLIYGLVCLFIGFSTPVLANDFAGTYGFSAKAIGMGNAVTSTVNDWSSVYYNISGLGKKPTGRDNYDLESDSDNSQKKKEKSSKASKTAEISKNSESEQKSRLNQLSVSFLYSQPVFNLDISRPDVNAAEDLDAKMAIFGGTLDINTIVSIPSWLVSTARIGFGAGIPVGSATKVNDVSQQTHNFIGYGREAEQAVIIGGIGLGFLDDTFGLGAGVNMGFGGEGVMRMDDLEVGSGEQNPTAQAVIDLKTNPSLVAGLYVRPGRIFPVLEDFELGLAYRQEKMTEIEGIPATAVTTVGHAELTMIISTLESYTPDTYTAGVSYKYMFFKILTDVEFQKWSGYRVSKGAEKVYKKMAATASDENGDGVADGYLYEIPELEDIFVIKLGLVAELLGNLEVSAGYNYQPSTVSKEKIENSRINYLDSNKHIVSAGCTIHLPKYSITGGPVDITAAFQAQFLEETTINKTVPTAKDPGYTYGGWCPTAVVEASMRI